MAYELPKLAYAYDALVPHIDAKTMEIHHGKHHQAYITNANNLLKDQPALAALDVNTLIADLSKVPDAIRGGLRNNAGGHSNHSFFWTILGPGKGGAPKGKLAAAIDAELGGFAKLKEDLEKCGLQVSRLSDLPDRLKDLVDHPIGVRKITKDGRPNFYFQWDSKRTSKSFVGDDIPF